MENIANTILKQLGGINRLVAMTGAYNFIDLGNGVSFKLKNPKANYVKIVLNSKDLYNLEIGRIRAATYKVLLQEQDLYYDQLKPMIEKTTGLYLSFKEGGHLESDENGEMLKNQVTNILHHANELNKLLQSNPKDVEPWVITKAQRSVTDLADITHYLEGESKKMAHGGQVDANDLVGKYYKIIPLGMSDSNIVAQIRDVRVSPAYYEKRVVTMTTNDDNEERFPLEKLEDFMKGADVTIRDDQGEPYIIQLMNDAMADGGMMANGGVVKFIAEKDSWKMSKPHFPQDVAKKVEWALKGLDYAGVMLVERGKDGRLTEEYLYHLDLHDLNVTKEVILKEDEEIFRYVSYTTAVGGIVPLVKINLKKGLVYYSSYNEQDPDKIEFERKGLKALYINLTDSPKYNQYEEGGMMGSSYADGGEVSVAEFDGLKKGDKINITYKSSISNSNSAELMVKSKTTVGKGKSWESEKITFTNLKNPRGVNFFAYKRKNGHVGFAIGDLAIWDVKIGGKMAEGGNLPAHEKGDSFQDVLSDAKKMAKIYDKTLVVMYQKSSKEYTWGEQEDWLQIQMNDRMKDDYSLAASVKPDGEVKMLMAMGGMMANGGEIMKHKYQEYITIELLEPTNKGWKVKQIETHNNYGKKLAKPKEKIQYYSKAEIKDLFKEVKSDEQMAMGGTTFEDKVSAVKSSLLKRKKVSPKVQKDYGKTYSPAEAEDSAKRIVGKMTARERMKMKLASKKSKK